MNMCPSTIQNKNFSQRQKFNLPSYTLMEEIMNSVTHGLGIVFSIVAYVLLLKKRNYTPKDMACITIYCSTLFVLYTVSTLYHALKTGKTKAIFRKFDHCSIFLLIAGTYTPLCTMYIKGPFATAVLIGIWITAIAGIILNAIDVNKFSKISLACYIIMGWSVVFIAKPVFESLSSEQFFYLLAGGIFYTVGAVLYVIGKKIRYMHSIWHLFVLAGSVLHFFIIY